MSIADNNPLFNSEYFLGPIETIVCSQRTLTSGHLSLHDVIEAYRTLSTRVRGSCCHLSVVSASFPALEPLRDNGATVAATLRRDILRGARHTSSDQSSRQSGPLSEAMSWEQTVYNTNRATDVSTLRHYALRLLSEIFRFPTLSSMFTSQDLGLLLADVISIIPHPQPPTSKASKTTMLSSWIVRTQRLPKDVLRSRMEDLILCLKLHLEAAVRDTPSVVVTVVDALDCIVNLLTFHRHVFVERLAGLLPSIFPFVMHTSPQLRHHAALVLASFSHTFITYRTLVGENTLEAIRTCTDSFLTPETTRHPTSSRKLPPLLDAAVSSTTFGSVGEDSPWALTVVASFAVLLGPSLFLRQGPLKLVMNITQKALRHRPGRDLNPLVWRTFIWSMTQLYSQRNLTASSNVDIIQRCVLVLKQALHAGLGAALLVALLEMTSRDFRNETVHEWVVSSVIDILHDMLSSKYQDIRDDACRLLGGLTCGVGATSDEQRTKTSDSLLPRVLFDGSLLRADKLQVEEMARTTGVFSPRRLSQEDILTYWVPLSSCFVSVVRNCLKHGDADLTTAALPIWQSLLLAQAQPIQGNGQNTASPDFGLRLSSLLSQFLPEPCVLLSREADSIKIQLQSLVVSKQLWVVVQNIFSRTWLTSVASAFLTVILQRAFYLANREVLTNWSLLCSALIVVGIPNVFEFISHQDETQSALEIKKHLWRLVATHGDSSKLVNWQDSISILVFPMGSWSMSEDDLDIWERALERSRSITTTSSEAMDIIDGIVSKCPAIGPSFSINTALRVGLAILRHVNREEGNSISMKALSYLCVTFTTSYPPQPNAADVACELIEAFHCMIINLPVSSLESVVVAVQTGLALWIEDKSMSLSDKQFNDIVMPLYDSLLQRLQSLPLSVTSLNALVPLLTAAFSRIPPPALGPAAFRRFFYAVHARLAAPSNTYSDELRVCLDACVRGYGGEWPSGMVPLSSASQTQSQFQLETRSTIAAPVPPAACEVVEEQIPHLRSIEHEVIPDSQCAISDARFPNAQNVLSPTRFVTEPSKENHESQECTGLFHNPETKKRRPPQDMPASKRHRATTSTNDGLRTRSVPLPRTPLSGVPGRRSNSTPKTSPSSRLVMDCVEVVPLRRLLHRREAEAERHDKRGRQLRSELDDHAFDVTPERPFVPRVSRAQQEKDEIVPETPDAVLRPDRVSLPTGQESSPSNGSPTRLLGKAQQPLGDARAPTMAARLASAFHEVNDALSRPGVSQMPVEELVDSAQLLDAANIQLRRALARKASKNVTAHPA